MLTATRDLLTRAREGGYGVGAFNVYNLEEILGVIAAAEAYSSPVILQVLPKALELVGSSLIKSCLEAGRWAKVPVSVHLDHCTSEEIIIRSLDAGVSSVMADGSHLSYDDNVTFTRNMVGLAKSSGAMVEAELGRLTGTEDDWTVAAYESCLTDPQQAEEFAARTRIQALAVCVGNVHGKYPCEPDLDFQRLSAISRGLAIPIVLHGTSGLPDAMIRQAIDLGVCKFNVNTELREAYLCAARQYMDENNSPQLMDFMRAVIKAVGDPVKHKMVLFGSAGKAGS